MAALFVSWLSACGAAAAPDLGPWGDAERVETGSSRILVGTLVGDAEALLRAARGGGEPVWVQVRVEETLKGPDEDSVPFRFFSCAESNRYGDGDPSGPELVELLGERRLVFLVEVGGACYLQGTSDAPGLRPATPERVQATRVLIARHRELAGREPAVDDERSAEVGALIEGLSRDAESQRANLRRLEALGHAAVPAIVRHMDSRVALAEPGMILGNHAEDAFESHRQYSPELVVDALAALLNQLSGESFGLDWNRGNEADRGRAVHSWRVYAHYVAAGAAQPPR